MLEKWKLQFGLTQSVYKRFVPQKRALPYGDSKLGGSV